MVAPVFSLWETTLPQLNVFVNGNLTISIGEGAVYAIVAVFVVAAVLSRIKR